GGYTGRPLSPFTIGSAMPKALDGRRLIVECSLTAAALARTTGWAVAGGCSRLERSYESVSCSALTAPSSNLTLEIPIMSTPSSRILLPCQSMRAHAKRVGFG